MTLPSGLMNFLRKGQFTSQDSINRIVQEFNEITTTDKG